MRTRASVNTEEQALSAVVIAQERKRKSSRGWCIELIAGNHCDIEIRGTKNTGKNWNGIQAGCQNGCQNEIEVFALSH
jgi:hypothetical protein